MRRVSPRAGPQAHRRPAAGSLPDTPPRASGRSVAFRTRDGGAPTRGSNGGLGVVSTLVALTVPSLAASQVVEPMVTDRPDQTESAQVVPVASVQVELGAVVTDADFGREDTESLSLLTALARVGLCPILEARVGFAGWTRRSSTVDGTSTSENGFGSLEVGFKMRVAKGRGVVPAVAVLGSALLPTGSAGFRAERVDPAVRLAVSHDLGQRFGLGYNVGLRAFSRATDAGDTSTETEGLYTLALGVGLSERLGLFLEAFGAAALSDRAVSAHLLDGGFTLLAMPNLQFDVSGGLGYAGSADDWFAGVGISFRLPR